MARSDDREVCSLCDKHIQTPVRCVQCHIWVCSECVVEADNRGLNAKLCLACLDNL